MTHHTNSFPIEAACAATLTFALAPVDGARRTEGNLALVERSAA